jgi:hypothetical protein
MTGEILWGRLQWEDHQEWWEPTDCANCYHGTTVLVRCRTIMHCYN